MSEITPQIKDIEANYYPLSINETLSNESIKVNTETIPISESNIKTSGQGSILRGGTFESPNFVKNLSGWQINSNGSAEFQDITARGVITATSGAIGGWDVVAGYIYNLQSGTPTSSPNDGIVMASGNEGIIIYEDTAKRVELGYLASGIYGLKGYATDGTTVVFELSDTQQKMAGWLFDATSLADNATAANAKVYIDSANTLIRLGPTTGNYVTLDGANLRLRSSNYSAGVAGFTIEPSLIEAENAVIRGEIRTSVITYQQKLATGGTVVVAKSGGRLKSDVTTVVSPTTFNVDIEDPPSGHTQLFAVNDILFLRNATVSNWVTISSVSDQTTFYRYVCVLSNGSAATFTAGTGIIDYGQSGDGFLEISADDTNAPFYNVKTHAGSPWTTTTERLRIGNLNGFLDYVTDLYGIGIGESTKYLKYDPTNGLTIAGSFQTATSGQRITLTTTDNYLRFYDASNQIIALGGSTDATNRYLDISEPTGSAVEMVRLLAQNTTDTNIMLHLVSKGIQTNVRLRNENTSADRTTNSTPLLEFFQLGTGSGLKFINNNPNSDGKVFDIQQNKTTSTEPIFKIQQSAVTSTNFRKIFNETDTGVSIWISDGTTPNGNLTGAKGDICLYSSTTGQIAYCTAAGTTWTLL